MVGQSLDSISEDFSNLNDSVICVGLILSLEPLLLQGFLADTQPEVMFLMYLLMLNVLVGFQRSRGWLLVGVVDLPSAVGESKVPAQQVPARQPRALLCCTGFDPGVFSPPVPGTT